MLKITISSKIIHPYFRTSGYAHIHIPTRLAKQCNITPGNTTTLVAYVKDDRLIIEQIKEAKNEPV